MKLLVPAMVLVVAACSSSGATGVTDVEPVGEGLKVIGYAIVGAAVLGVVGKLIR